MTKSVSILVLFATVALSRSQVGGGAATYGQVRQGAAQAALASELARRNQSREDSRFLDASVLMNVPADEYVAVFGLNQEGKTLEEARTKIDALVRDLSESIGRLGIAPSDISFDFVAQNRIYGYDLAGNIAREVVVGFEAKKNLAIRYKEEGMLDRLTAAAAKLGVFDLVKVDYVVRDIAAVQTKLMEEAARIIRRKRQEQERLVGVRIGRFRNAATPSFGTYFPTEMYETYQAQESETALPYNSNVMVQRARKPNTFYYRGLTAKGFDQVVNPVVTKPMVQFTVYLKVWY